jgi:hypothetical protein
MASELVAAAEAISAIAAIYIFYSTLKACRASSIPYLLGIPAAFGLLTLAFIADLLEASFGANLPRSGGPC